MNTIENFYILLFAPSYFKKFLASMALKTNLINNKQQNAHGSKTITFLLQVLTV